MGNDPNEEGERRTRQSPAAAVADVISRRMSNLASTLKRAHTAKDGGLSLTARADGSWFCVVRLWEWDKEPQCVFGAGATVWDALQEANSALARNAWRRDKFAPERAARRR